MKKRFIFVGLLVALTLAGFGYYGYKAGQIQGQMNNRTPVMITLPGDNVVESDLDLSTLEVIAKDSDQIIHINDLKEPVVIVHLWATWCAPCLIEYPQLVQMIEQMNGKVALLSISMDYKKEPLDRFLNKISAMDKPHIYQAHDTEYATITNYKLNIKGIPTSYILDKNRIARKKIESEYNWADSAIQGYLNTLAD